MKLSCPACGAEVLFKSRASVFGVCSFCSSTLVRQDLHLESLGKMTEMPQDMSPLQIGTQGTFENSRFEIVGRQRVTWEAGSWNEWFLHFDNGKDGWLADAQGFYMMSFQVHEPIELPDVATLQVAQTLRIQGRTYRVDDIRLVQCQGSQGELPVRGVQGRQSTSVDLVGESEQFGNIDYAISENRVFLGKYVDFDDFKFMNLREFDGW